MFSSTFSCFGLCILSVILYSAESACVTRHGAYVEESGGGNDEQFAEEEAEACHPITQRATKFGKAESLSMKRGGVFWDRPLRYWGHSLEGSGEKGYGSFHGHDEAGNYVDSVLEFLSDPFKPLEEEIMANVLEKVLNLPKAVRHGNDGKEEEKYERQQILFK